MQNAPSDVHFPPAAPGATAGEAASGLIDWLDDLLDTARDRGDATLARLVAGVMDDLRKAGGGN